MKNEANAAAERHAQGLQLMQESLDKTERAHGAELIACRTSCAPPCDRTSGVQREMLELKGSSKKERGAGLKQLAAQKFLGAGTRAERASAHRAFRAGRRHA